jgi:hypothetical protein
MSKSAITIMVLAAAILSGCSRWAIERYDAETASRIDARLEIGMSFSEFRSTFPDAKSMGGNDADSYLVSVQSDCFWCHSGRGFRQSTEIFARVVSFESGSLTSIEPLPGVRP